MPIVKIPLQHKFGIISLSRAEILLAESRKKINSRRSQRNSSPVEISQEFVTKYNATPEAVRGPLDLALQRALLHAKYKAGLLPKGKSRAVESADVSSAWLELTLLCQCYGQHQQDALILLALSLNHAPLSSAHVASLMYIVGLCFQWLKSDEMSENTLRSGELLLLKIVYHASLRLYYHHLTGTLPDMTSRDDIKQLKVDLEGFEVREKVFRNFPEALLQWKLSLEVALLVCEERHATLALSPVASEITDDGPSHSNSFGLSARGVPVHHDSSLTPILWHSLDVWQCLESGGEALTEAIDDLLSCSTEFNSQRWLEGALAMYVLCIGSQINVQITTLLQCLAAGGPSQSPPITEQSTTSQPSTKQLPQQSDKDFSLAVKRETRFKLPPSIENTSCTETSRRASKPSTLNMLGVQPEFDAVLLGSAVTLLTAVTGVEEQESPSSEEDVSHTLLHSVVPSTVGTQSLLESVVIPTTPPSSHSSGSVGLMESINTEISVGQSKSTALLHSENKSMTFSRLLSVSEDSNLKSGEKCVANSSETHMKTSDGDNLSEIETMKKVSLQIPMETGSSEPGPNRVSIHESLTRDEGSCFTLSQAPLSDGVAVPGSQVAPSTVYQRSVFSTPDQHLGSLDEHTPPIGLRGWSTEVALLYTLGMANCVLYGRTSVIQRQALLGDGSGWGLVQLAELSNHQQTSAESLCCWSVRHIAVLGLSRVCRVCRCDPLRDGFRAVAWDQLMTAHSTEREVRVQEAFRLAQACPDLDNALLTVDNHLLSSPLLAHIADGLSCLFLPPVDATEPPPVKPRTAPERVQQREENVTKMLKKVQPKVSTHLKMRAVSSFNTRTMATLNSIAQLDWRRQMEEERRLQELEEREAEEALKKEYEEKMQRKQEKLSRNRRPQKDSTEQN